MAPTIPEEHHDENTLQKAYEAVYRMLELAKVEGDINLAQAIILERQNDGILFRERG